MTTKVGSNRMRCSRIEMTGRGGVGFVKWTRAELLVFGIGIGLMLAGAMIAALELFVWGFR